MVSNIRVGPERIPDPDSWEDMSNPELGENWQHGYQILSKTTFKIDSASPFTNTEELCNGDEGPRGLRYLDGNSTIFTYYTWGREHSENRPDENAKLYSQTSPELFIYMDTNPNA